MAEAIRAERRIDEQREVGHKSPCHSNELGVDKEDLRCFHSILKFYPFLIPSAFILGSALPPRLFERIE